MDKTIKLLRGRLVLLLGASFIAGVDAMLLTYRFWQAEIPLTITVLIILVIGMSTLQIASQFYVVHKNNSREGSHFMFRFEALSHIFWMPSTRFALILGASAMLGAQLTLLVLSFDHMSSLISATLGSSAMALLLLSQLTQQIKMEVKSKPKVK